MILSLFLFALSASDSSLVASAATPPYYGVETITRSQISDQDTSNFMFLNRFDVQSQGLINYQYINTDDNNGRIWTDKSVNVGRAFIYDAMGGIAGVETSTDMNEFLITYSALSQTVNETQMYTIPSDTVFVIDVSGSMASNTVPGTSPAQSRIAVTVDALNYAINELMKADPNNRIAVAVYGGQSVSSQNQAKVYPVLRLGRYDASTPIFTMSGTSTVNVRANTSPMQPSFVAEGGTPTQLGLRRGGQMLLDVTQGITPGNDGTVFQTNPGQLDNVDVIRQPNIILMTDGEPTYAWTDYRMDSFATFSGVTNTTNWYDVGNGSTGDMGLTALTVMTASYIKERVREHYYGTDLSRSVGFYNIGLGVNTAIANGMLDPYGLSAGGIPNAQLIVQGTDNMLRILDAFAPGATPVTFQAIARGANPNNPVRNPVTVSNAPPATGLVKTCNYDTMSFTAMNKQDLDNAFNTITQQIVSSGNYSTNVGIDSNFSGYLVFSDVVGEYMQFGRFIGLYYNNAKYDSSSFTGNIGTGPSPIRTGFLANLVQQMIAQNPTTNAAFNTTAAGTLLDTNIASAGWASGRISYYTDNNRTYLGSLYSVGGTPAPVPGGAMAQVDMYVVQGAAVDTVTGDPNNLTWIIFQVITILPTGNGQSFPSVDSTSPSVQTNLSPTLRTGDQVIRWYVPASLIPMRSVEAVMNGSEPARDDFGNILYQVSEAAPLRVISSVIPNYQSIGSGVTSLYASVNKGTQPNSYFFYSNRWRALDGRITRGDLTYMSLSFFEAAPGNTFYTPAVDSRGGIPKLPIPVGPTGTLPYSWDITHFPITGSGTMQVQRLGNNGRLELQSQATITISKTVTFDAPAGMVIPPDYDLSILVYGTDSGGNLIYYNNLSYPKDFPPGTVNTGEITLTVPPGTYVIQEAGGYIANYTFFRPSPIIIAPPVVAGTDSPVAITNPYTHFTLVEPMLRIRKVFNGLPTGAYPDPRPPTFELTVTAPDDVYIFDLLQSTNGSALFSNDAGLSIPAQRAGPLLEGLYTISEANYETATAGSTDYNWVSSRPTLPFPFNVTNEMLTVDAPTEYLIVITNLYVPDLPPPPPNYSVTITKEILGLDGLDVAGNPNAPKGLVFKVWGTDETGGSSGYVRTIPYEDMVNNTVVLNNMPAGNYRITELGGSADFFDDPRVTINGQPFNPSTGFPFTMTGAAGMTFVFGFTNDYRPPPPPPPPPPTELPPPAPQTSVDFVPKSHLIPLIAITLGALFIGAAEIYRRAINNRKKPKNNGKK